MAPAHNLLGISLVQRARPQRRARAFRFRHRAGSAFTEAHINMGNALAELIAARRPWGISKKRSSSSRVGRRAAQSCIALQELSRHDEAIERFREVLEIDPEHKYNLGSLL